MNMPVSTASLCALWLWQTTKEVWSRNLARFYLFLDTFFLNAGIPENKNYIYNNLGIVNNIVNAQIKVVYIKSKKVTI